MATLSRKFLSTLGIEEDKADAIIETYQSVLSEIKAERDKYKEEAESVPSLTKALEDLKAQTDNADTDSIKAELDSLKKEYEDYKASITAKETTARKSEAYRDLLRQAGVSEKRFDAIMRVTDLNSLELTEDGKVTDADSYLENIKADWSDFIQTSHTEGANIQTPPTNKGTATMTREEIRAIPDAVARQKAMAENPSLFGLAESE